VNNLKTYEEFNWKKGAATLSIAGALSGGFSSCEPSADVDYKDPIEVNINKDNIELKELLKINNIKLPCVIELSNINCGVCRKYYVNLKKVSKKYNDINFYYILTGEGHNDDYNLRRRGVNAFFTNNKAFDLKDLPGNQAPLHDDKNLDKISISTSENIEKLRKNIMMTYDFNAFPRTLIIDKNGKCTILKYGYMEEERLERYVKKYIPKELNSR